MTCGVLFFVLNWFVSLNDEKVNTVLGSKDMARSVNNHVLILNIWIHTEIYAGDSIHCFTEPSFLLLKDYLCDETLSKRKR